MAEACGIIGGVLTLALLFRLFFRDFEEFGEAIRFWFTPEIVSIFRGEWSQDWFAELKLTVWLALGGIVGFAIYEVVADHIAST